ncbi:phosphatidylserine decarboxylase 2 [Pichia kluyveri]|uniref:phosphatidylserine decarboxylase n=1 Tax=Pichia kluyveri TaxID=36015 RepID=A0AAV5R015_PICKL|nr:phosphatidylserine decarboxylase 2 [Pichia kluyveri]
MSEIPILFSNQLVPEKGTFKIKISVKNEQTSQDFKIRSTLLHDLLKSSIIFDISQITENDELWFNIRLVNLSSIKRLKLKNETINFTISILDSDNQQNIPFSVSLLNLFQLVTGHVNEISKSISNYLLDINFTNSIDDNYIHELSLYLSSLDNLSNTLSNVKVDYSDASSINSEISNNSSIFPVDSLRSTQSNTSLSSMKKSTKSLTKSIFKMNRNKNTVLYPNSNFSSNSNSNINLNSTSELSLNNNFSSTSKSNLRSSSASPVSQLQSDSSLSLNISNTNPDKYHDDTDGFLILQIESATGLPPFRNTTHLGYDMDPFVVVSFSKQIFKTSVCRHALNPSWKNQLINLRISKYSFNFKLKLSVYDFDYFTYNDDICSGVIQIDDLINESEINYMNLWTYKKIPLVFSNESLMKKTSVKLEDYQPELSIRFKYIKLETLSKYNSKFNPMKEKCPNCNKIDKTNRSALQHLSICTNDLTPKQFIHKHFITSNNASRRWYSKILAHIAYGRLTVGGNNAHILVQDRETGLILEEKISAFVKLGIRLLYKSVKSDNSSEKIKRMLRTLSIKQGSRYDKAESKNKIAGFVNFHGLSSTMQECLISDIKSYNTFNEFFSRKLKPGARPIEGGIDNKIIVSVADSRLIVFNNINNAKNLWIKGKGFTIGKLLDREIDSSLDYSVGIFRLAPQDYHRVHCPLNGTIIKINHIHGSYYTVNPMAIRSSLDVFGDNIRTIITLRTTEYGDVEIILVGAMMVGSILITAELNKEIKKGQEIGYFKFGGSTVILVFNNNANKDNEKYQTIEWDGDLISNSNKKLETLVKVGMSVGHSTEVEGFKRGFKNEVSDVERREVIRRVTGLGEGYGVGVSMGDNIKAKIGGMIDDVMSVSGIKSFNEKNGNNNNIDELVKNDWEINELTTLDGINDYEFGNEEDLENNVDIQLFNSDVYGEVDDVHED